MTLPPSMVARLKRLIPLLGSPLDGEALGARNAIVRELAAGQRDLHDLAASIGSPLQTHRVDSKLGAPKPGCDGDLARACRDLDLGRLTAKERAFVHDACRRGFAWQATPNQASWLTDIFNRLQRRAAA